MNHPSRVNATYPRGDLLHEAGRIVQSKSDARGDGFEVSAN